jgi:hypothetical protein
MIEDMNALRYFTEAAYSGASILFDYFENGIFKKINRISFLGVVNEGKDKLSGIDVGEALLNARLFCF